MRWPAPSSPLDDAPPPCRARFATSSPPSPWSLRPSPSPPAEAEPPARPRALAPATYDTTASGLRVHDITVGEGATAEAGDAVRVHYTGWLRADSTRFDSSVGGNPFRFRLGAGRVIAGWDEGVAGMQVGGVRLARDSARPRLWRARRGWSHPAGCYAHLRGRTARHGSLIACPSEGVHALGRSRPRSLAALASLPPSRRVADAGTSLKQESSSQSRRGDLRRGVR